MTTVAVGRSIEIRDARPDDNAALIDLTAACVMEGSMALRVDRSPDFFALNRLEGDAWRAGVALNSDERIIGCVAVAGRDAYVNGSMRRVCYASDLKVHPSARGSGAADLLTRYAQSASSDFAGETAPCVLTVLSGNRAMQHRARGPRGTAVLSRFASLAVQAIPLLWERRERVAGVSVRPARGTDMDAMTALWSRLASARQLAATVDAEAMTRWIAAAPGLTIGDYLVAADSCGRLTGFMGVWDQSSFKQLRVVRYSTRMGIARHAINAAAALVGGQALPRLGEALPVLATVHVCAESPHVLRALLLQAYRRWRGRGYACLTIGLDATDPLLSATKGLLGQTTMVDAYVASGVGAAVPDVFDNRPLHFETALV